MISSIVAQYLRIPFLLIDFVDEFEHLVIDPFIESYKEGETPNPCVTCNIQFKFDRFAKWCFEKGADMIATGHYCRTKKGHLYRGKDKKKDQSYFLNQLDSEILKTVIFPLENLTKKKVRDIAKKQDRSVNYLINDIITNYISIYHEDDAIIF